MADYFTDSWKKIAALADSSLGRNFSWLLIGRCLRILVSILVTALVARQLGPDKFGQLGFALSVLAIATAIAALANKSVVIDLLVKDEYDNSLVLGAALTLCGVGSLLAFLMLATFGLLSADSSGESLVAVIAFSLLFHPALVFQYFFEAVSDSAPSVIATLVAFFFASGLRVVLVILDAPLVWFAWAVVAEALLALIFLLTAFRLRFPQKLTLTRNNLYIKTIFRNSLPLLLSGIVLMIQARIDQVMLKYIVGDRELGYYTAALGVIESAAFLPAVLLAAFMPSLLAIDRTQNELFRRGLLGFYQFNILMALVIGIPIAVFSPWIVETLFGAAFGPSAILLSLMTGRLLFAHLGAARHVFLVRHNLMRYALLTMLIGTALNVLLNLWLISEYQSVGAVIATLLSFAVTIVFLDIVYEPARDTVRLTFGSISFAYRRAVKKNG